MATNGNLIDLNSYRQLRSPIGGMTLCCRIDRFEDVEWEQLLTEDLAYELAEKYLPQMIDGALFGVDKVSARIDYLMVDGEGLKLRVVFY